MLDPGVAHCLDCLSDQRKDSQTLAHTHTCTQTIQLSYTFHCKRYIMHNGCLQTYLYCLTLSLTPCSQHHYTLNRNNCRKENIYIRNVGTWQNIQKFALCKYCKKLCFVIVKVPFNRVLVVGLFHRGVFYALRLCPNMAAPWAPKPSFNFSFTFLTHHCDHVKC